MNAWSTSWFVEVLTLAIGYWATTLMSAGMSTPAALRACGGHIGDVDDPGIRLARSHLGHDTLHVLLQAHRRHRDGRGVEDLLGVLPARHLRRAEHDLQVRLGQVGDTGDALRVARRHDDLEQVRGEDDRLGAVEAGGGELVHVRGVGGGEDVCWSTLGDLLHERRRRVVAERRLGVGVGGGERLAHGVERVGERRGREHRDVAGDGRGGGGRRRRGGRGAAVVAGASVAGAAVVPAESLLSLPHAAATSANSVSGTRSRREVRFMRR